MMALFLGIGGDFLGMMVLTPVSWFPVLNAVLPMIFVKALRTFILSLFCVKTKVVKIGQTSVVDKSVTLTKSSIS